MKMREVAERFRHMLKSQRRQVMTLEELIDTCYHQKGWVP